MTHDTSLRANRAVKRSTLKSRCLLFALDAGPGGFTDADLRAFAPSAPESSLRKRRTELTQKNWIVPAGFTRPNEHGQDETVWIHRRFDMDPPEIGEETPRARRPNKAREEERAAVVAWLRANGTHFSWFARSLAGQIERGEHLK